MSKSPSSKIQWLPEFVSQLFQPNFQNNKPKSYARNLERSNMSTYFNIDFIEKLQLQFIMVILWTSTAWESEYSIWLKINLRILRVWKLHSDKDLVQSLGPLHLRMAATLY